MEYLFDLLANLHWAAVGPIILIDVLITCAVMLLDLPFLKVAGGALLVWIGAKLLLPEDGDHEKVEGRSRLMRPIRRS